MNPVPDMQTVPLVSYQEFISIVLTALAVILAALGALLAVLGIGLAVAAFMGYTGLKKFVRRLAEEHVTDAMTKKLSEYPDPAEFMAQLRSQIVAGPADAMQTLSEETERESAAPISQSYPEDASRGEERNDAADKLHS